MSRSYRAPIAKDQSTAAKRVANKIIRNTGEIADGSAYKRVFNSWNISDYAFTIEVPKSKGKKAKKAKALAVRK
jgi:hypothetical protein